MMAAVTPASRDVGPRDNSPVSRRRGQGRRTRVPDTVVVGEDRRGGGVVTISDPVITQVDFRVLHTVYPRNVGRNARLGGHGSGGATTAAVVRTENGDVGWGLVEGPVGVTADVIGRSLSELLDPVAGVTDPAHLWLDVALHDLAGVVADLPVY